MIITNVERNKSYEIGIGDIVTYDEEKYEPLMLVVYDRFCEDFPIRTVCLSNLRVFNGYRDFQALIDEGAVLVKKSEEVEMII